MVEWFYIGVLVVLIDLCFDYFILGLRLDDETIEDWRNNPHIVLSVLILSAILFPLLIVYDLYKVYMFLIRK